MHTPERSRHSGDVHSVGGYHIMRRLGSGTRADVFLGRSVVEADVEPQLVAIKMFRTEVTSSSIANEIEALSRNQHPHSVRLIDLASVAGATPCLIMQRLVPGGLARLLADQPVMSAGEVVTILAPIAAAIASLHTAGFSHRSVSAPAVLFDERGAPVLVGYGAACAVHNSVGRGDRMVTSAMIEADSGTQADLLGLDGMARALLRRVTATHDGDQVRDVIAWLDSIGTHPRGVGFAAELGERMFALAEARPVELGTRGSDPVGVPHRIVLGASQNPTTPGSVTDTGLAIDTSLADGIDRPAETEAPRVVALPQSTQSAAVADRRARSHGWMDTVPVPAALSGLVHEVTGPLIRQLSQAADSLRGVRRRVWVAAGVGLAAVTTALVLLQQPTTVTDSQPERVVTEEAVAEWSSPASDADGDPVVAVEQLLVQRSTCFRVRSILCLDSVDQLNSAVWKADRKHIRGLQNGAEVTALFEAGGLVPTVVDRMGDTVLIAFVDSVEVSEKNPASVLMIKTEAGWRLRALLPADGG